MARQVKPNPKEEYSDFDHLEAVQQWSSSTTQTGNGTRFECKDNHVEANKSEDESKDGGLLGSSIDVEFAGAKWGQFRD